MRCRSGCGGGGGPASIADGADSTQGSKADPKSVATDGTPASVIALLKGQIDRLQAIVSGLASPGLPAGGSTASNQALANTKLDQLHGDMTAATPADEAHIDEVGGRSLVATASFTTPSGTTAYAAGNAVSNSATAASVAPMQMNVGRIAGGSGMIRRVRLKTTDTGFAGATVRVLFYRDLPTVAAGDHAACSTSESNYLGAADVTLDRTFTDAVKGIGAPNAGSEINFDLPAGQSVIYALLAVQGAVTPQGAKTVTIAAEVLQN